MDIARLKELRAIGVREYEQDEHGFRVVFDERPDLGVSVKPATPVKSPHRQALVALKGFDINPDMTDGSPRASNGV